ncbi:hypothetical protein ACSBR1_004859 [Camellia fascicularis]
MSGDSGGDRLAAAVAAIGERWRQLRINLCCQNQRECHPCRKESKLPQDKGKKISSFYIDSYFCLGVVITKLPSDLAKKALEVLCLPAVTPLQEIINQGLMKLGQITARELTVHIDRLANIFSCGRCNSKALANIQSHL